MDVLTFTEGAFAENTFLVVCADGRSAILVDPGAATAAALSRARARKLEITAILLTHAHLDHIEGVALARRTTGAPVHLHPGDRVLYDGAAAQAASFGLSFQPPPPPDADLTPDSVLAFGGSEFKVVFVPGHAPGHVMFVSRSEPIALVGDVIFLGSIGRTDLPGGDYRTLMESIRSRVLALPPETRLYPGHGPDTTVGHEIRTNPFVISLHGGEFV